MHTKTDTALSRNKDTAITLANAVDVVYGRGNHLVIHPGNIYYRSLVDALAEYYVAFPKHKKKLVSDLVHESIQAQTPTGRFLAEVRTGHYTELDVETAIRKISQCFREKQPMIKASSPSYGKTKVKMNTDEVSQKIQEMRTILKGMGCSLDNHGKGIEPAASSSANKGQTKSIAHPIFIDTYNERTSFFSRNRVVDPKSMFSHSEIPPQYTQHHEDPRDHAQMMSQSSSFNMNNPLSPRATRSNRRSESFVQTKSARDSYVQEIPSSIYHDDTKVSTAMSRPHTSTRLFHPQGDAPKSPSSSLSQYHYGKHVSNPSPNHNQDTISILSSHFPSLPEPQSSSLDPLFNTYRKRAPFDPNIFETSLRQSPPAMLPLPNTNTMQRQSRSSLGMDDTAHHAMVNIAGAVEDEERNLLSRMFSERSILSMNTVELQNIYNYDPTVQSLSNNDHVADDMIAFESSNSEDETGVMYMESLQASSLLPARTEGCSDNPEHESPTNNVSKG